MYYSQPTFLCTCAELGEFPIYLLTMEMGHLIYYCDGFFPFKGTHPNFFRMVTTAPQGTEADMDFLLNEIERLGKDL